MSKKILLRTVAFTLILFTTYNNVYLTHVEPRLTIVFIIDQFAYHYVPKIGKHFQYGLHTLLTSGINYPQARHEHGIPETTPGHHAVSAGTLPQDHGAVLNQWIGPDYNLIDYDIDMSKDAAVFIDETNTCDTGKSSKNTMIDGLSDQFVLHGTPDHEYKVFALSLKSHPAIATANRLGKAIWFDDERGIFTSSKKYFTKLPEWLSSFNKRYGITKLKNVKWKTMYKQSSAAYNYPDIKNYDYAAHDFSMIALPSIPIDRTKPDAYKLFSKSPHGSKALIELAKKCIDKNMKKSSDHMLLWISLSTLDLIGHFYGPDSLEAIDTLYHLDYQIKELMDFAKLRIGEKKCLFAVTGDHGIPPIPELAKKRGITFAKRIMAKPLMDKINGTIAQQYGAQDILKAFEPTYFVLNKEELEKHNEDKIIKSIKKLLLQEEGIKEVWTVDELRNRCYRPNQPESFYKSQLYNHRCGDIICMPQPYCFITYYPKGTSHLSPYNYDTHVPLALYQKGRLEKKVINRRVSIPQLPVSLAYLLNVNKPSASNYSILPGIE